MMNTCPHCPVSFRYLGNLELHLEKAEAAQLNRAIVRCGSSSEPVRLRPRELPLDKPPEQRKQKWICAETFIAQCCADMKAPCMTNELVNLVSQTKYRFGMTRRKWP